MMMQRKSLPSKTYLEKKVLKQFLRGFKKWVTLFLNFFLFGIFHVCSKIKRANTQQNTQKK